MITALTLTLAACEKSDPPLADNLAQFESAEQGMDATDNAATFTIKLSRPVSNALSLSLELAENGVAYGTHYTTSPAAVNGVLPLTIPAGSSEISFTVTKKEDIFLSGTESVGFTVKPAGEGVLAGPTGTLTLRFSSIISEGSSMTLNGGEGGTSAVNSVYVDFSNNQQTSVLRSSWDLGFYGGADYRVIINNVASYSVVAVNKTDINTVTEADFDPDTLHVGFGYGSLAVIDNLEGDLSKTVIGAVSATESENKVYVVNSTGASANAPVAAKLKKIRILRNGDGYTLQYADINATSFQTLNITKDAAYNFKFVSFANGLVSVEPAKDRWDIQWTYAMYKTGAPGAEIPYAFSDLVFTNIHGGAQVAEVLTSTGMTYASFGESNIASVSFSTKADVVGSKWRSTLAPVGVATDRFYVVKDAAGNVYKLKFINFHSTTVDGGTRGYPNLEYVLVKKA